MPSQSPHFAADGLEPYVIFWLPPEAEAMGGSSDRLSTGEVTLLLKAWSGGEQAALDKLTPLVEQELHRLAHKFMAQENPGHTLQTTALVNEVYLRLVKVHELTWQDRAHFFAISARMMRRILTDFARSRNYLKRGGDAVQVSLDEALVISPERGPRHRGVGRRSEPCEGVQHAHQKAIIHRDLKPANILVVEVDGKPVPRIIDFGLARATTPRADDDSLMTRLGHFIGTPGYMSPEQADPNVHDIDTRTDVYSLGVVL